MKRMFVSSIIVLAVASLLQSQPPYPVYGWYPLGLEKSAVHCVLGDDTSMILAGTDKGVMVRHDSKWFKASFQAPVFALARVSKERVVAAIGDGKGNSDGMYLGNRIKGEPYYQFKLLDYMITESFAVSKSGDTVFAGNGKQLVRYVLPNAIDPAACKPEKIKLPPYAFGVEQPSCRALDCSSGRLVAGGYDRSPMPGPGHLLYNVKDSMHIEMAMNVSALTGLSVLVSGGAAKQSLAVGTIDSGIYLGRIVGPTLPPVQPWKRLGSPKNEPVNAMIAVPTMIEQPALVVAVKSGIFMNGISTAAWTEIGSLPAIPVCICLHGNGFSGHNVLSYLAGTDDGLYRYGLAPSTGLQPAGSDGFVSAAPVKVIAATDGPRLVLTSARAGGAEIAVNGIAGRLFCKLAVPLTAGVNSIVLPSGAPGRGTYIVTVRGSGFAPVSRTVLLGK